MYSNFVSIIMVENLSNPIGIEIKQNLGIVLALFPIVWVYS